MKTRLLLANSDASLADIYRRFFSSKGYDVDVAENGLDCLDKIVGADVVILDLDLPWGGGDGVLARMRDDPLITEIPVVLVASESSAARLAPLVVPPVIECLQKPFRLAELLDLVQAVGGLQMRPA